MLKKLFPLLLSLLLLLAPLSACAAPEESAPPQDPSGGDSSALTWTTWGGYEGFWSLLEETYPDIKMDFIAYSGANYNGYSWAQMRSGDLSDLFSVSAILDESLTKERMLDLSGYDFVNNLSTSLLDQVSIDGGIYFLPVSNAMYGIYYNKTLMEEKGWKVPGNFAELEALCAQIKAEGLIPGVFSTETTGTSFSAVLNLAKTDWLTTPEGVNWERDFLTGEATAAGTWEKTMDYVQRYIDIGMFSTDPDELSNSAVIEKYLAGRKAVFFTMALPPSSDTLSNGDKLGMMPYISADGSKNIYMFSPYNYIGINKRLTEPGNEEKLEKALRLMELLFSPEGQATFLAGGNPCLMNVLRNNEVPEDSMIYDARQAQRENRVFRMTFAGWDSVLTDMGIVFNQWFRGEEGMDGPACIARMDELQSNSLHNRDALYFCESTASFTMEESAALVGKALGSAVDADAAMVPYGPFYREDIRLQVGVTGKLYSERINLEVMYTICPRYDGEYALLTMTGEQLKELVQTGFDPTGDGQQPFPYALAVKGGGEPEDGRTYQVAFPMGAYAKEVGETYQTQVEKGSLRAFLREWMEAQKTISPDGNPWN